MYRDMHTAEVLYYVSMYMTKYKPHGPEYTNALAVAKLCIVQSIRIYSVVIGLNIMPTHTHVCMYVHAYEKQKGA